MTDFSNDLAQAFIGATILTLKIQCRLDVQHAGTEIISPEKKNDAAFGIGGLVGILATDMNGSAVLGFSQPAFLKVLRGLLNDPKVEVTKENEDAAAELLNIIFAQSRTILGKKGQAIQMAIPSVLRGTDVGVRFTKKQQAQIIKFKVDGSDFFIKFAVSPMEKAEKSQPSQTSTPTATRNILAMQLIESTVYIFKVQFQMEIKPGKPFEKMVHHEYPFEIAGVVGISSNSLDGSFLLVFQQSVYIKLINKVFGEASTEFNPETDDLVAEITNMILGATKKVLNTKGFNIQMAIPTVIRGSDVHSSPPKDHKAIVIPFTSALGDFSLELEL